MQNNVSTYVSFQKFFPDEEMSDQHFESILKRLSLTDTIFWCSKLLTVLFQNTFLNDAKNGLASLSGYDKQMHILKSLKGNRTPDEQSNNIDPRLKNDKSIIFFEGQIVELIRRISLIGSDNENDGESFNEVELREDFLRALLYSSDQWDELTNQDLKSCVQNQWSIEKKKEKVLRCCRFSKMFFQNTGPCFSSEYALERAIYFYGDLLERLSVNKMNCELFKNVFESQTGLNLPRYQDMLALLAYQLFIFSDPREILSQHKGIFNVNTFFSQAPQFPEDFKHDFIKYIDSISQTSSDLKEYAENPNSQKFLLSLRNKPLFKASNNRYCVLAPVFFIEKATVGPLFTVIRADKDNDKTYFSMFGYIFEEYVREILNRKYPRSLIISNVLESPFETKDKHRNDIELDAVLNYGKTACFVEMKSTWLNDSGLYESSDKYLKELRSKYCDKENHGGVYQLANKIKGFVEGEWQDDRLGLVEQIYPILIIHNRFDDALQHSWFFNQEFLKILGVNVDQTSIKFGRYCIKPLIVISVDVLELLENNQSGFLDVLAVYDAESPDRNVSFHDFCANKNLRRRNEFLHQKFIERLDKFRKLVGA